MTGRRETRPRRWAGLSRRTSRLTVHRAVTAPGERNVILGSLDADLHEAARHGATEPWPREAAIRAGPEQHPVIDATLLVTEYVSAAARRALITLHRQPHPSAVAALDRLLRAGSPGLSHLGQDEPVPDRQHPVSARLQPVIESFLSRFGVGAACLAVQPRLHVGCHVTPGSRPVACLRHPVALSRLQQQAVHLCLAVGLPRFLRSKSRLTSVQRELSLVSGPLPLLRRWLLAHVTRPDQVRWHVAHRYAHALKDSAVSMRDQS